MGKFKLIAKARLLEATGVLLALFSFCFILTAVLGDMSLLASAFIGIKGISSGISSAGKDAVIAAFSVTGLVLLLLLSPPLRAGRERWFFLNAAGKNTGFSGLFFFFKKENYLRSLSLWYYSFAVKGSALIIFLFPGLCLAGVTYYAVASGLVAYEITLSIAIACAVILLIGLSFYFVFSSGFFMYWQTALSESISPSKAYEISNALCRESTVKICRFKLSFTPWWLLCVFVFPAFYVWGYYKQSQAVFCLREEWKISPKAEPGQAAG